MQNNSIRKKEININIDEYTMCPVCGGRASEVHHVVFRSQAPSLIKCELNLIPLCPNCHDSIHHRGNKKLDRQLKLKFQNKLEYFFIKEYLTKEEINEVLNISDKALERLLKTLKKTDDKYYREDVIRACMGNKLILEGDED